METFCNYQVFISYKRNTADSREGEELAFNVYKALEEKGYYTFYDQNSIGLGKWGEQISAAIAQADIFILTLSKNALYSEEVLNELRQAVRDGRRRLFIPIAEKAAYLNNQGKLDSDIWDFIHGFQGIVCEDGCIDYNRFAQSVVVRIEEAGFMGRSSNELLSQRRNTHAQVEQLIQALDTEDPRKIEETAEVFQKTILLSDLLNILEKTEQVSLKDHAEAVQLAVWHRISKICHYRAFLNQYYGSKSILSLLEGLNTFLRAYLEEKDVAHKPISFDSAMGFFHVWFLSRPESSLLTVCELIDHADDYNKQVSDFLGLFDTLVQRNPLIEYPSDPVSFDVTIEEISSGHYSIPHSSPDFHLSYRMLPPVWRVIDPRLRLGGVVPNFDEMGNPVEDEACFRIDYSSGSHELRPFRQKRVVDCCIDFLHGYSLGAIPKQLTALSEKLNTISKGHSLIKKIRAVQNIAYAISPDKIRTKPDNDYQKARLYYHRYRRDKDVPTLRQAIQYFQRSADKNNLEAITHLGNIYYYKDAPDDARAQHERLYEAGCEFVVPRLTKLFEVQGNWIKAIILSRIHPTHIDSIGHECINLMAAKLGDFYQMTGEPFYATRMRVERCGIYGHLCVVEQSLLTSASLPIHTIESYVRRSPESMTEPEAKSLAENVRRHLKHFGPGTLLMATWLAEDESVESYLKFLRNSSSKKDIQIFQILDRAFFRTTKHHLIPKDEEYKVFLLKVLKEAIEHELFSIERSLAGYD